MASYTEWKKKNSKGSGNKAYSEWKKKKDEADSLGFSSTADLDSYKGFLDRYNGFVESYNQNRSDATTYLNRTEGEFSAQMPFVRQKAEDTAPSLAQQYATGRNPAGIKLPSSADKTWGSLSEPSSILNDMEGLKSNAGGLLKEIESIKKLFPEKDYTSIKEFLTAVSEGDTTAMAQAITNEVDFRKGFGSRDEYEAAKEKAKAARELSEKYAPLFDITDETSSTEILNILTGLGEYGGEGGKGKDPLRHVVEDPFKLNYATGSSMEYYADTMGDPEQVYPGSQAYIDFNRKLYPEEGIEWLKNEFISRATLGDVESFAGLGDVLPDVVPIAYYKEASEIIRRTLDTYDVGEEIYEIDDENAKYMEGDEAKAYLTLKSKGKDREAEELLSYLQPMLDIRRDRAIYEGFYNFASDAPVPASLLSIGTSLGGGVEHIVNSAIYGLTGEMKKNKLSYATSVLRQAVSDKVDLEIGNWDAFDFVYSTTMSGADSLAAMGLFGVGGGVALGLSAAAQGTNDALARGLSPEQAFWNGLASGTFEMLFETLSISQMQAMKAVPASTFKEHAKNLAKSMVTNASEEFATEVANVLYDVYANGDLSEYAAMIEQYQKQGMNPAAARQKAIGQLTGRVIEAAGSGALMGAGFAGLGVAGSAIDGINKRAAEQEALGRLIERNDQTAKLVETSKKYSSEKAVQKYVQKLEKAQAKSNERAAARATGRLYDALSDTQQKKAINSKRNIFKKAVHSALQGKENAAKAEKVILKAMYTGGLSASEQAIYDEVGGRGILNSILNSDDFKASNKAAAQNEVDAYHALREVVTEKSAALKKVEAFDLGDFNVAKDGTTKADGKETSVKRFAEVSEDGIKFLDEDGNAHDVHEMELSEDDAMAALGIERIAESVGITTETANFIYADMKASGMDAATYLLGAEEALRYGKLGVSSDAVIANSEFAKDLSPQSLKLMLNEGARLVEAQDSKHEAKKQGRKSSKAGRVIAEGGIAVKKDGSIDTSTLTKVQKASLMGVEALASVSPLNFHIFRSQREGRAYTAVINGKRYENSPNGIYVEGTNDIWIDINAGDFGEGTMLRTAAHEISHYIKDRSPRKWRQMARYITDELYKGGADVEEMLKRQEAKILKRGETDLTAAQLEEQAYEEFISDALTDVLTDGSVVAALARIKQEDKSLWQTIKDAIADLLKRWGEILGTYKGRQLDAQEARALSAMEDVFKNVQQMYAEAFAEANESIAQDEAAKAAQKTVFGNETVSEKSTDHGVKNQLRNSEKIGQAAIERNESLKNVDPSVLLAGVEVMGEMADIMLPYLEEEGILPPDNPGKTIFKNGSYGRTAENALICVRTLTYEDFKDRVAEKIGRPLTVAESLLVSQKIYDIATEPQCIYCYVAADRKSYDEYLGTYWKSMNKYIKALKAGGDSKTLYNEYLDGRKDTKQQQARWKRWEALAKSGASYITQADLATKSKRDGIIAKGGAFAEQVKDAQRYAQSASWAKKVLDYRAYNGEILKMQQKFVDMLNDEYGLRMYSFSDYTPAFIVENMQMLIDASVRGLRSLAYTKDTDYAEIFAPTGQAINISCFAKLDPKTGEYVEDTRQGANWKKAQELRRQYKNVGAVMVATNDKMVEWALKQDWIDVVIPYHIVKTGTTIANEYGWRNYTAESADRQGNKAATIYPTEHNNDFATYKKLIEERGLTPRFSKWYDACLEGDITEEQYMKLVNEVRLPASALSAVTPNFNLDAARRSFGVDENGKVIEGGFVDKGGYMGGWYREGVDVEQEAMAVASDIESGKTSSDVDYGMKAKTNKTNALRSERNTRDSEGRKLSEGQMEYFAESVVRDKKGRLIPVYHGTKSAGFNVFSKSDDIGYFFAKSRKTAETYSGTKKIYAPDRRSPDFSGAANYKVYLNITNPLIIEGKGAYWNNLEAVGDKVTLDVNCKATGDDGSCNVTIKTDVNGKAEKKTFRTTDDVYNYFLETFDEKIARSMTLYLDSLTAENGKASFSCQFPWDFERRKKGYSKTTRDMVRRAYESSIDYDGVIFKDVIDGGDGKVISADDLYVIFGSEQAKSVNNTEPTGDKDIRYSERNADSARSLLANALEANAQTPAARKTLERYKKTLGEYEEMQKQLDNLNSELRQIYRTKGEGWKARYAKLKGQAKALAERIDKNDKRLLSIEGADVLKPLIARERARAAERQKQHSAKVFANYRERRKITEEKKKIAKVVKELNGIFSRGTKKRNVKAGMKDTVAAALASAELIFSEGITNEQIVTNGFTTTLSAKENRLVEQYLASLQEIDEYKAAIEKLEGSTDIGASQRLRQYRDGMYKESQKLKQLDKKLSEAFERERIRYNRITTKAALDELANAYKGLKVSNNEYIRSAYDDSVYQHISELGDYIADEPVINTMSLDSLEKLYKAYRMVLHTVQRANKLFANNLKMEREEAALNTIDEVSKVTKGKGFSQVNVAWLKKQGWGMLKPIYAFRVIGSKTLQKLFDNIRLGQDTWYRDVAEAKTFKKALDLKYGSKKWDVDKTFEFRSTDGKAFNLTVAQMMSIYAYSRRTQAGKHISIGGITFKDGYVVKEHVKVGGKKTPFRLSYELNGGQAYTLSPDIVNSIISKLSEVDRGILGYVEEMQTYLSEEMGAKGNEVSRRLYGVDLFEEKNYFPLRSDKKYIEMQTQQAGEVRIKNAGFTNALTPNASNTIVIDDFFEVWAQHVNEMSLYHGFVLPLEDFNKVYSYGERGDGGSSPRSVRGMLNGAFGSGVTRYITQLITDLNGGARSGAGTDIVSKLTSLFKKGAVFASFSVAIQQPSAILRAGAYIDAKYFVKLPKFSYKAHKATWEKVKKYAPVAGIKEMGYFDTGLGRSTVDWINDRDYEGLKENLIALFMDGDYRDEVLSFLPAFMDECGWNAIWDAVEKEVSDKTDLEKGTEEFYKACGKRFTEVIELTQVYDSVLSRSGLMRSTDNAVKAATAFMSEPTVQLNMYYDAAVQIARNGKKSLGFGGRVAVSVILSVAVNALLKSIITAGRDDDDDNTLTEKYVGEVVGNFISDVNPLGLIPYIRDVISIAQGYEAKRPEMNLISDSVNAIRSLSKDTVPTSKKITNVVGATAAFFGLPLKNIMRDATTVANFFGDMLGGNFAGDNTARGMKFSILESITGKNISDAEELYEAYAEKDYKHYNRVLKRFDSEDDAKSALRSVIGERYRDGELDYTTASKYLEELAKKEGDEYWALDKWNYMIEEGTADGYRKFGDFYTAVETGKNLKATIKEYTDHGVTEKTLASQITSNFKPLYKAASKSERARMKGYLLNAYVALGKDRSEKSRDIDEWLEDD